MRQRLWTAPSAAVLLGVFFLALYLLTGSSDLKQNGDTDLRYQTAQAIVDHGRLWIAHPLWMDTRVARGLGHHLYAFYAPGQATLMIPLYLVGKVVAHHLSLPYDITTLYAARSLDLFLGAALVVVFFFTALAIGYSLRVSVILSLLFGLATPAWPDAQSALEQTQVDLFLLISVLGAWLFVCRGMTSRRPLLLSGFGIGFAVFTRYDAALYLPIVALYPAVLRRRRGEQALILQDWLVFAAGCVPWLVLVAAWNWARFGAPWLTGLHEQTLGEPPWLGFVSLTVSPGKGILWYMPLLFLLPSAWTRFARFRPGLAWLFAAIMAITLLFYANVLYWHGDPAWGPRYLYAALPYAVLPLGTLLETWRRLKRPLQAFAIVLAACGLLLSVAAVSVNQWRFWYRLEAAEAHTAHPFRWGAAYYHYYWNIPQSPVLVQVDNLYQVLRLTAGDNHYRYTARPTPCLPDPFCPSNPADNYPINSLAYWWLDPMHPLLGAATRVVLAGVLFAVALIALALLISGLLHSGARGEAVARRADRLSPAPRGP
jgi:hypothetical protein